MLTNPFFWLGQLGLLLSIFSCAVLAHRFRDQKLIVILPFWFALLMSLSMLVRPAIYNMNHTIPAMPYLYRLAMGLLLASRAYVWRQTSRPDQVRSMDQLLQYLVVMGSLFMLYLGYKLKK